MTMAITALSLIDALERMHTQLQQTPARLEQLRRLQQWQAQRLERTYMDLSTSPRYRDTMRFFLEELYGPHDFSSRNRDLRKVLAQWERRLPQNASRAVLYALELEVLTQELDLLMVDALKGAAPTPNSYAAAYRQAGRRHLRQRQVWLVVAAGRALDGLVHLPMIGMALRLARLPARLAGVTALHEFLERGHAAFQHMGGAEELLRTIEKRETALMQQLFAGTADPFEHAEAESVPRCS
jgi:hypothetical protein